jgi:hypothetical protein
VRTDFAYLQARLAAVKYFLDELIVKSPVTIFILA